MAKLTGEHIGKAAVRFQRPLRYMILEALLIALGVVFALFAQEWQQHRRDRAVARQALASINDELEHNRGLVEESLSYHREKMELLQGYLARRSDEPDAHPEPGDFPRGFVAPAQLLDVAWVTAREVDALTQLPYEDILELGRIYSEQDLYRMQAERTGEIIYRDLYSIGARGITEKYPSLVAMTGAFLYRETGLLAAFEAAIPNIETMGDHLR